MMIKYSFLSMGILDVIYHPRACKMNLQFSPYSMELFTSTNLLFDIVRNDKHYTDSWLFKVTQGVA